MNIHEIPLFTIFILILIVSANFIGSIFPCRVQKLLSENVFMKHILGFFTMIFFVMLSAPIVQNNILDTITNSFLLYIYFILLTKTAKYIFLLCFILLLVTYILILYKEQVKKNNDNKKENDDKKNTKHNNIKWVNDVISLLYTITILFTIFGVIIYMGEKKFEYGKKFDYMHFWLGNPDCKGASPKIKMSKALHYAFK